MAFIKVAGVTEIKIDNSLGTLLNMTAYVNTVSALGKEITPLDVTAFADGAERVIAGIEKSQEVTVSGDFNDAATTGPDAVFGTLVGTINTLELHPAGTASGKRKISGEFLWTSYTVSGAVKDLAKYELKGKLDGTITIGTN